MTDKHLISISDFANVGPTNAAYPQTYRLKNCFFCSEDATKIALFEVDNIVARRLYCDRHVRGIQK
jgi:hypothetical protein